jgi:hypothetical protein
MGNTVLSHALFSCHQLDLDPDQFFSSTGDAHAVVALNRSELTAHHLAELPDPHLECVLEIVCTGWWEVLRIKMSYSKWMLSTPGLENFSKFYSYNPEQNSEQSKLWQEFYATIRDPAWPNCATPADIESLPLWIQQEIDRLYTAPDFSAPDTLDRFVEWLANTYYDNFLNLTQQHESVPALELGQYIQGDYQKLIDVCSNQLGWTWDHDRSRVFFTKVLKVNSEYLTWLESIQSATNAVLDYTRVDQAFAPWEQALIIAKACEHMGIAPHSLDWNTDSCNSVTNNVYLKIFKR